MSNSDDYINKLMNELASEGIVPSDANSNTIKSESVVEDNGDYSVICRLEQIANIKFSEEQKDILSHRGNACILACAGSGKTSILTYLLAKRIMTGEIKDISKLICTTYSKAGANEMNERISSLFKQIGLNCKLEVRTLHSFFLKVLRTFGVTADVIDEKTRKKFIREACNESGFVIKDDDLLIIDNLLSFQVNNLLSDKKTLDSYANTLDNLELEQYSSIRKLYANKKAAKGLIDYDDMQTYLYLWTIKYMKSAKEEERAIGKSVIDYCKAMWTDFYIDEAQDVSKMQFAILKAMVVEIGSKDKLDRGLVFIGDDDQAIYQWRGGDPSIILGIGTQFNMRTFVLSTNYRCCDKVVNYAAKGIRCNNSRYNKSMQAFNSGGTVKILPSVKRDLCSLSELSVEHIKYWIRSGYKVSDIAVLSRNNFHLAILSNMLLREGIYCNSTNDMKLTKSAMYKDIKALISLSEPCWKHDLTKTVLWKLCRFMGMGNVNFIAELQNNSGLCFSDTLGWLVKNFLDTSINFDKQLRIPLDVQEKAKYYMGRLGRDTIDDLKIVYEAVSCDDRVKAVETLMYQYLEASSFLYKTQDKQRSIRGLVLYIKSLIDKDGIDKTLEFLRVTEQLENGNMVIPGDKVTLTTIHSAKGREWKNVIMFGCDNVSMPSIDGIENMLKDNIPVGDIYDTIDEERRLFYVGNTRAKENLLVLTYTEPSIFILECLGVFNNQLGGNNKTVLELVGNTDWTDRYKDDINKFISDSSGDFYYDSEDYKEGTDNK